MDKQTAVAMWRTDWDDDAQIAKVVAQKPGFEKCKAQHIRHWRLYGHRSKYQEAILEACKARFADRQLEWQLVPIRAASVAMI